MFFLKRFLKTRFSATFLYLAIFFFGWMLGIAGYNLNLRMNPPKLSIEYRGLSSSTINFSLLGDVLDRINESFLFKPVDGQKLLYGAVSGMVNALGDPYSAFLDPQENAQFQEELEGKYEGIGVELGIRDSQLIIVAPFDGSPAAAKGVRAGDKILQIEGESTEGITLYDAVTKIRGPAGTVSTLVLQRGDGDPFEVKITRAAIIAESVRLEEVDSAGSPQKGGGIFKIRLSRFSEGALEEWDSAVEKIKSRKSEGKSIKGIVLDLRDNPGGYLNGAVYVASEFLTSGTVVIQEAANGARQTLEVVDTENNHALVGVPVMVLVNGGSASASEILAAALRERASAKLVGEKTFGKGTVQDVSNLNGGAGLHLTVAKWLSPSKEWFHGKGLKPDYEVELTEEDWNAGRDPQLDRALELLR